MSDVDMGVQYIRLSSDLFGVVQVCRLPGEEYDLLRKIINGCLVVNPEGRWKAAQVVKTLHAYKHRQPTAPALT